MLTTTAALALLLLPTSASPEAVYEAYRSKIANLDSATGAVVLDMSGGPVRYDFAIKKPGKFYIWGENQAFICNGSKVWQYKPKTGEFNEPPFEHYGHGPLLQPFRPFFKGDATPKPTQLKMDVYDGKPVLHVIDKPNGQVTLTQVIDPVALLPLAHIQKVGADVTESKFLDIFENVPVDETRFELPKTAVPFQREDFSGKLLPIGQKAPPFTLDTSDGRKLDLAKELEAGKVVWLNFWFYACGPCQAELPRLNELRRRLSSQGLRVVTVNKGDDAALIDSFLREKNYDFPVGMNARGGPDVAAAYGVQAFPSNYLIAPDGTILARFAGFDEARLLAELEKLGIHLREGSRG
jgi:thiol-disulfide isomerase/thioredoxin